MRVLANALIYLVTTALNQSLAFLILPILTHYLTPADYGTVALFNALVSFAVPFVGMSVQIHVTRHYFRVEPRVLGNLIFLGLALVGIHFGLVTCVALVLMLLRAEVAGVTGPWLMMVGSIAFTNAAFQVVLAVYRNAGQAARFGALQVGNVLVNLALSVLFVAAFGLGWQGRVLGIGLSSIAFGVFGVWLLWRRGLVVPGYDRERVREIYRVCLPMIPHMLSGSILTLSARFFLDAMTDKTSVGLFAVGTTIGSLVATVTSAYAYAWNPWLYKSLANLTEPLKRRIVRQTWAFVLATFLLAALVTFAGPFVLDLVTTKDYANATVYIGWAALAAAFQGMYIAFMPYLVHLGRTRVLATSTFVTAGLNLGLNWVLIARAGPIGAAWSAAVCSAVKMAMVFASAQRLHPMPWLAVLPRRRGSSEAPPH